MNKRILHIDMDAFFASVEEVRNPELRGKPLIIGGSKDDIRGVVSTANYEARKYGVHSAMSLAQAKKLCPHGIFMRGTHGAYSEESRKIKAVLEKVSPILQMASIDEAYIDITGSLELFGGDNGVSNFIKAEIKQETQLSCTIAVSSNKLISKIGSDYAKPDGFISIPDGEEAEFIAPMPLRKMPGIGPKSCESLERMGIKTLGQLASFPLSKLEKRYGLQTAMLFQRSANGISNSTVKPYSTPKSISKERTFSKDIHDWKILEQILTQLLEQCMYSLRKQEMEARSLNLKVRYSSFETKTYAKTLTEGSCIDRDFMSALFELIPKAAAKREKVRLVGVGLSHLMKGQHQTQLFEKESNDKWERALHTVDDLKNRLGKDSVHFARNIRKD